MQRRAIIGNNCGLVDSLSLPPIMPVPKENDENAFDVDDDDTDTHEDVSVC